MGRPNTGAAPIAAITLLIDCEDRFLIRLAGEQRTQLTDLLTRVVDL